jgi:hypothetical protein
LKQYGGGEIQVYVPGEIQVYVPGEIQVYVPGEIQVYVPGETLIFALGKFKNKKRPGKNPGLRFPPREGEGKIFREGNVPEIPSGRSILHGPTSRPPYRDGNGKEKRSRADGKTRQGRPEGGLLLPPLLK